MTKIKWVLLGGIILCFCLDLYAEVSSKLEPLYAEAVLAYNGRDFNKSLQLLDQLVKQEPNTPEFLELKALILKTTHNDKDSVEVYQNLIRVKKEQSKPEKEVAPYAFELGVIRFREGNYSEAKTYLEEALDSKFNAAPCHFFLGLIEFRNGSWSNAEDHFEAVVGGSVDELIPASHFYLGQIFMKLASPSSATQNLFFARKTAKDQMNNEKLSPETRKIATQIYDATEKALKPFDKSGFFASISFLTAEDTNVLLQGNGVAGTGGSSFVPTNQGTVKETVLANVGYSSSPLATYQVVPSFRTSYNYNFNSNTETGEYVTNDISLYFTRNALARTSYGIKLEGMYIFQDQPINSARNYTSYSTMGSFGPYFRRELWTKMVLTVEAYLGPQYYFGDTLLPTGSTLLRSGVDCNAKVTLKNDRGARIWNPGAFVLFDRNNTSGSEYNSVGVTPELNDVMHLSEVLNVNLAVDGGFINYSRNPNPSRNDFVLTLDASGTYRLSSHYSILADMQYTNDLVGSSDSSVVALYQYNRFVGSLGFTYTF